jgi:hypothetical protein
MRPETSSESIDERSKKVTSIKEIVPETGTGQLVIGPQPKIVIDIGVDGAGTGAKEAATGLDTISPKRVLIVEDVTGYSTPKKQSIEGSIPGSGGAPGAESDIVSASGNLMLTPTMLTPTRLGVDLMPGSGTSLSSISPSGKLYPASTSYSTSRRLPFESKGRLGPEGESLHTHVPRPYTPRPRKVSNTEVAIYYRPDPNGQDRLKNLLALIRLNHPNRDIDPTVSNVVQTIVREREYTGYIPPQGREFYQDMMHRFVHMTGDKKKLLYADLLDLAQTPDDWKLFYSTCRANDVTFIAIRGENFSSVLVKIRVRERENFELGKR